MKVKLGILLEERARRLKFNQILKYYPDTGPLRRELYKKHTLALAKGATCRQRMVLAANRVGKTEGISLYEAKLHATGVYPHWWRGRRFDDKAPLIWCAGDTSKTVRDIIVRKLLGPVGEEGTGLIPGDSIIKISASSGIRDSADSIYVRHKSGGQTAIVMKSYDQRRESFQGTEVDFIVLDEEPPMDIYQECLVRTMTNQGSIILTFTPFLGMSEVVLSFIPDGDFENIPEQDGKAVIMASWDDVPHLDEATKKELLSSIPEYQQAARSRGIPALGSGVIYPVKPEDLYVDPFNIPNEWKRAYGLDVGWRRTAAVWGAIDPNTDILYLYSEHYVGEAEPYVHAKAIKDRGNLPGVIDPAAENRAQADGKKLIELYRKEKLDLAKAKNAVETGLADCYQRMKLGKLKVFNTLTSFKKEMRLYARDEKGKVIKKDDHLMDAMRYLVVSGLEIAKPLKVDTAPKKPQNGGTSGSWMG